MYFPFQDLDVHDYIDWENHPDKFEELQSMILNKQCEVEKINEEIGKVHYQRRK